MPPSNTAAWLTSSRARLTVSEAPYTPPGPDEVVIKVAACAMNPLDYKIQSYDPVTSFTVKYPAILGSDVAGTIVEAGANVKGLEVGQRVIGNTPGMPMGKPQCSGFQAYTVLHPVFVTPLPSRISFTAGAVLPLAVDTAAAGLFQADHLGLPLSGLSEPPSSPAGVLVVWGGASSVGCNVMQIAKALGLAVVATASEKNFGLCRGLGAESVVDYRAAGAVDAIVKAVGGRMCMGAFDCVGLKATQEACAEILGRTGVEQGRGKVVMSVLTPEEGLVVPDGVAVKRIFVAPMFRTEIPMKVHAWVGKALEDGRMVPMPEAKIVGQGLEAVQGALDELKNGVSASKLVVVL